MTDKKTSELDPVPLPLLATDKIPMARGAQNFTVSPEQLAGSGFPVDLTEDAPDLPPTGTVRLFRREVGGRSMPAFVGSSGLDTALQPFFGRNKIARISALGNGTALSSDAFPALQTVGTATTRSVATTNKFTRSKRIGYVSAATAAALASIRINVLQYTTGDGAGDGGLNEVLRFGFSAITSDMRAFFGIRNNAAAPTNVEPSTITGCIGIGRGAADTNLKLFYGGTAAQPPIDLGPDFPANTANVDLYDLALFAPPNVAGEVRWEVTRVNTGHVAAGVLTGGAAVLPAASVLLTPLSCFVTNNATLAAVAFDFVSLYVETDS